jgi:hypothetical protein
LSAYPVKKKPLIVLILLVIVFAGCATRAPAQQTEGEDGTASLCVDGDQMRSGPYIFENNQWGKAKANGPSSQCLLRRIVDGVPQHGWSWEWPGFNASVFAYPEVIYGWKPWSGGRSTDPKLPMKVTDIQTMKMRFDLDLQASGGYNLAPEIWLTSTGEASSRAAPARITTEVMFWMIHENMQPAGMFVEKVPVDGVVYQLWRLDSMGDKGNGEGWVYYAFVSTTPQNNATLDIRQFIQYLLSKKYIAEENYVASIEFGNEIAGGKGTAWVKEYSLTIE